MMCPRFLFVCVCLAIALLGAACASQNPQSPQTPPTSPPPESSQTEGEEGPASAQEAESPSSERPATSTDAGNPSSGHTTSETPEASSPTSEGWDVPRGQNEVGSEAGTRASGTQSAPVLEQPRNAAVGHGATNPVPGVSAGAESEPTGEGSIPETPTADEQAAALDGELDRALEDFDGVLLDEQEMLEERPAIQAGGTGSSSGSGREAGGRAGRGGEGDGPTGSSGNSTGGGEAPAEQSGGPDSGGMAGGAGAGGAEGTGTGERVPTDVGDGSDDDIVARQLREAAMNEEDAELRERLCDEYRAYKASIESGSGGES